MNNQQHKAPRELNFCATCGFDFGGIRAFDMHRVGTYEHPYDDQHPEGRRCLSAEEMLAQGMYINSYGRWSQPRNRLSERLGLVSEPSEQTTATV